MNVDNIPWKLTITSHRLGAKQQNTSEHYFKRDTKYKSYTRWEVKLSNVSIITNLKVEKSEKLSLKTGDSFTAVLKIRGIAEKDMGTIDCITPVIHYNPKPWLGNIKKNAIYVKVYVYEKPSGISGTNAYQAGADNYNIFMSELRELWRMELINELTQMNDLKPEQDLSVGQMYEVCKKLHKRCKSNKVWDDMQTAFNQSFGNLESTSNTNNFRGSNPVTPVRGTTTNQMNYTTTPPSQTRYNLRSRR